VSSTYLFTTFTW